MKHTQVYYDPVMGCLTTQDLKYFLQDIINKLDELDKNNKSLLNNVETQIELMSPELKNIFVQLKLVITLLTDEL